MERELVKIVSNNPAHPQGYYIQFRDKMGPDDIEYFEDKPAEITPETPKQNKKKVKR